MSHEEHFTCHIYNAFLLMLYFLRINVLFNDIWTQIWGIVCKFTTLKIKSPTIQTKLTIFIDITFGYQMTYNIVLFFSINVILFKNHYLSYMHDNLYEQNHCWRSNLGQAYTHFYASLECLRLVAERIFEIIIHVVFHFSTRMGCR